jgi:elongator complex protein 1
VENQLLTLADAIPLLRHLILASTDLRELAKTLQAQIISFRSKLSKSIDETWRDRSAILAGVAESGGMGLAGDATKAMELVPPVVGEWKGVGVLGR